MNQDIQDIQVQLDRYVTWVKNKTALRQVDDWVEITTPFLDRHNDLIQVYAKRDGDGYTLTDDGHIIGDLNSSGCNLSSDHRQALLSMTLAGFGVQRDGEALTVKASPNDFPAKKHNLIQAMLSVNDMFFMAAPIVTSLFLEDVTAWLDQKSVRYIPHVKLTGKSGFDYVFDFAIPKSAKKPERLIKAINNPSRNNAKDFIMSWLDTKEVRPADTTAIAFLNDTETPVTPNVRSAFSQYDVDVATWSNREQYADLVTA